MPLKPFLIGFASCFVVLAPLLATFAFLCGTAMRGFGSPPRGYDKAVDLAMELFISLPVPIQALPVFIINGLCWALLISFLLAAAIAELINVRNRSIHNDTGDA